VARTSIQVQTEHSGLPRAMALRLIRGRPGDRLSCHHWLTPAPGRRTLTISPYAQVRSSVATYASTASHRTSWRSRSPLNWMRRAKLDQW